MPNIAPLSLLWDLPGLPAPQGDSSILMFCAHTFVYMCMSLKICILHTLRTLCPLSCMLLVLCLPWETYTAPRGFLWIFLDCVVFHGVDTSS